MVGDWGLKMLSDSVTRSRLNLVLMTQNDRLWLMLDVDVGLEREVERWIVMWTLSSSVVVMLELSWKVKFLIYQSVYIPVLIMVINFGVWKNESSWNEIPVCPGPALTHSRAAAPSKKPAEVTPSADPEHAGGIIYLIWHGNISGSPMRSWKTLLGRGTSGWTRLNCCCDRTLDKQQKIGWQVLQSAWLENIW